MDLYTIGQKAQKLTESIRYCKDAIEFIECDKNITFKYINIHVVGHYDKDQKPIMIIPKDDLYQIFVKKLKWFKETLIKFESIKDRVEKGEILALQEFDEEIVHQMWHAWLLKGN